MLRFPTDKTPQRLSINVELVILDSTKQGVALINETRASLGWGKEVKLKKNSSEFPKNDNKRNTEPR